MTLSRYLKRVRGEAGNSGVESSLVAVELRGGALATEAEGRRGLTVVLVGGRRIEVSASFDESMLRRLIQVVETA